MLEIKTLVHRRYPTGRNISHRHRPVRLPAHHSGDARRDGRRIRGLSHAQQAGRAPPPEIAKDALLTQGRAIYLVRCAACHGNEGRGDGPLAANLIGPPVGNLTDSEWKHGDRPEQVIAVIKEGVPNTRMDGWGRVLDPPEIKAVAAYVYYLAKVPVPRELRTPENAKTGD